MRKFLVLLIVLFLNISTVFAAKIPDDVTNYIKKDFPKAEIRFDGLITIDNKVVHSHIHTPNGTDIVVLSRYGIFVYDNDRVIKCRNMRNLRWLLH